jgi:adenylate cyclase
VTGTALAFLSTTKDLYDKLLLSCPATPRVVSGAFMTQPGVRRKLIGILSADVKGYSRLMADDEEATVQTINAYRDVMAARIQEHRGRIVDAIGDNLLAEFSSVVDAVQCAVEIQVDLRTKNTDLPENRKMEFRIGVNLGDVIEDGQRIYGDGVNIAARLESLAEAGGICISGSAFDQVENKLDLGYEYLGEQAVKNISKPVRTYRVLMGPETSGAVVYRKRRHDPKHRRRATLILLAILVAGAAAMGLWKHRLGPSPSSEEMTFDKSSALELPDRPSIAVLPFTNMSGDPEQEYFSDGITEDLITDLSKVSGLFVISRNSVFRYKGKAVQPEKVSQELGVRYLLEGSVRRSGDRVRITAQLIDATTGGHLWAERYDGELRDIFALQDEVTQKIVTALATELPDARVSSSDTVSEVSDVSQVEGEREPAVRRESGDLRAYDYFWRGRWYLQRFNKEGSDQARKMFERAIELDPRFAAAYAGLGWTYYYDWSFQWSSDPQSLDRAYELGKRAVALNDSLPNAHSLLGHVYLWKKQYDKAIAEKERVIALNSNDANAYSDLAETLVWADREEEAIPLVKKAMRLNPHYPVTYLYTLGFAYMTTGQHEKAIEAHKKALTRNPEFLGSHVMLAAIYMKMGMEEEARTQVAEALRISPNLSLDVLRQRLPIEKEAHLEEYLEALHEAGLE